MSDTYHHNRRGFLKTASVSAAASLASLGGLASLRQATAHEASRDKPLKLALASYTLRKFDLDQTLEMTARVGLDAICLKSFHLPLDATPEAIKAAAEKVKQAGIKLYGGGVIPMKNDEQVNQAFEYAKTAGMSHIVAAPVPETLPLIDKKVQEYDIEVCIHNHGPGDKHFPTPEVAYEQIKGLDGRVGICHDVGHTVRYGADAITSTKKCADRILDVHIKDVTEASKDGHSTPCGRGVIDLPKLLRALIKVGYGGYLAFEYEEDAEDPLAGLAECVGYIRGVLDTV